MKEGVFERFQVFGDVVLAVELILGEDAQENVLGEDVLEQHLAHVSGRDGGADRVAAQVQELRSRSLVARVGARSRINGLPQVLQDLRQIDLELLLGLAELLDLRQLIVEEVANQAMQLAGAGHVDPHRLFAVLDQHGGLRVLEDDVVARVAPVELLLDLLVKVVVRVFGLPVAARHAQAVLHGAVGLNAALRDQFGDQRQFVLVVAAVGIEAILERAPDAALAVRPAELLEPLQLLAVVLDVRVGGHGRQDSGGRATRSP